MEQIIECPNCGQKNRFNTDSVKEAKCGKCWKIIYKNPKESEKEKIASDPKSYGWFFWLIGIIGFVIFINSHDSSSNQKILKSEPAFNQPEQATPYNGETKIFTYDDRVAPLKINTSYGLNYVVKLKDAYTKKPIMTIFVRGGVDIETKVPLGTYEITYASGSKWYGYDYLFGPETGYSKADEVFSFRNTGYQINGYTITLQRVSNGNLREVHIGKSDF
jgi:hypothetical protein